MATKSCPTCPHCRQRMPQPRVERLTSALATALQEIAAESQDGKIYAPIAAYRFRGTHARLALWGLIEELLHPRRSGSGQTRSGSWRPTAKGQQWLAGFAVVPSELHVLRGHVVGLGHNLITWEQAMAAAPAPTKGKARKAVDDEGDRLFLQEQARLERSYLEEDDEDDQDDG